MYRGFESFRFAVIVAVLVLCGVGSGKDVTLSEVPAAIRATIEREMKGSEIEDITQDEDNGKIVYEVKASSDNDMKIKIAEDGTLSEKREKLDTKHFPVTILNAVKKKHGDVNFKNIEKQYRAGSGTIYKIELDKKRRRIELEMKEDGTIIKERDRGDDYDIPGRLRDVRRVFMQLRGQLKVVTIGDSRTEKGVDPKYLLGEENQKYPLAFSFGPCARGMAMAQLLCEDYFAHGPKMEWVIYGLSTRVLNEYYGDGNNEDDIKKSRGYIADKAVWATLPEITELVPFSAVDTGGNSQWGYDGKEGVREEEDSTKKGDREVMSREFGGKGRFIFDFKRLEMLESAIVKLAEHNVNLLVFTPPIHPLSIGMPCTDDDGTDRESYDLFVAKMNELDKKYPNFYFFDVNNKGEHGLEEECFYDLDHLNTRGAKKLTLMLNDFIRAVDSGERVAGAKSLAK